MRITHWWDAPEWLAYEAEMGRRGERSQVLREAQWNTRVIDLRRSTAELWQDVRKGYRAVIRRVIQRPEIHLREVNAVWFKKCRGLHGRVAGQTRPPATWGHQARWLREGKARCWAVYRYRTLVAFAYILTIERAAYYFSAAATVPDVSHVLQWHIITALKARGVIAYETGWQGEAQTEKGRQIEFFRRGFGGADVPARIP